MRKEAYVEWILTPKDHREIPTKTAFADFLGVAPQTLRNYDRDPWVQAEITRRGRAVAKVDKLPDVIDQLYQIATGRASEKPSEMVAAARVLIDWTEKHIQESSVEDIENMPKDELLALIEKVYDVVDESNG